MKNLNTLKVCTIILIIFNIIIEFIAILSLASFGLYLNEKVSFYLSIILSFTMQIAMVFCLLKNITYLKAFCLLTGGIIFGISIYFLLKSIPIIFLLETISLLFISIYSLFNK